MALPIKETPILTGKDAKKFSQQLSKPDSRPISREDYERAEKIYKQMKQNSQSCF